MRRNGFAKLLQGDVLRGLKTQSFQTFEFDADGVVIAAIAAAPLRHSRMPGTIVAADELPDLALASNKEVGRDFEPAYALVVRVGVPVQLVAEQLLYGARAILAGRQTDGMHDHQIDVGIFRARAKVRRWQLLRCHVPARLPVLMDGLLSHCRPGLFVPRQEDQCPVARCDSVSGAG